MDDLLEFGKIIGAHGLNGELKVFPITRDASNFLKIKKVIIQGIEFSVISVRLMNNHVTFSIEGINDRTQAEQFKGEYISIKRKDAPSLDKETYYMRDIIGCEVYDDIGIIGKIVDIIETGSNDVYVTDGSNGVYKQQILIPAIKGVVLNIDINSKRIHVKIPKGLLDDEYI